MPLLSKSAKWRGVLCGLAVGLVAASALLVTQIGSRVVRRLVEGEDAARVHAYRDCSDPFYRALARGDIRPGDSFDALLADHSPAVYVIDHGEYRTAGFSRNCMGQCRVMAKNGRLVFAEQDIGEHYYTHFSTLTPGEYAAAQASRDAAWDDRRRQWVVSSAAVLGIAPLARWAADDFPAAE